MSSECFNLSRITDPFWSYWQETVRTKTLPQQFEQLSETNRLENFRSAISGSGRQQGYIFNDSDVYKWLEACAYVLHPGTDHKLMEMANEAIDLIEKAQLPDGYINTFFQCNEPEMRWRNTVSMHEMYCLGHLIESGVAWAEHLSDNRLLAVSEKAAQHVMSIFGPDKKLGYPGHEEIELALFRLADITGKSEYADFATWLVRSRGARPSPFEDEINDPEAMRLSHYTKGMHFKDGVYSGEYCQDHLPVAEHDAVVGHAVRAMYLYIAAARVAAKGGTDTASNEKLRAALQRTWESVTAKRMYITGGIGPSGENEGFTTDFDLPNRSAYAETCASIGLVLWADALGKLTRKSDFYDTLETALYNGTISGISLSGINYFYDNPLESFGSHQRVPWFGCACCPPNIARMIGRVGEFVADFDGNSLWINLPVALEGTFKIKGVPVELKITGRYPFESQVTIQIDPAQPVDFEVRLRIPDWSDEIETEVPGLTNAAEYEEGYACFTKTWQKGDVIKIGYDVTPKWRQSNAAVLDNAGKVALTLGPVVYCIEEKDLGFPPQFLTVDPNEEVEVSSSHWIVTGGYSVPELIVEATAKARPEVPGLYADYESETATEVNARFIPYFAWNNRGKNAMSVWIPTAN